MPNIGSTEILIIALAILLIFGNQKLKKVAKGLGETGRELKKAKKEFTSAIDETDEKLSQVKNEFSSALEETNEDIKKTFDLSDIKKEEKNLEETKHGIS